MATDPVTRPFALDHIAVAVRDLSEAIARYQLLGLELTRREVVESENAEIAFFDLGGPCLELVASSSPGSSIARSIEKRGEGLHHIALEVDDLEAAIRLAQGAGLALVHESPVPGADDTRIAFVHPKALCGVLVELVEKPKTQGRRR